MTKRYTEPFVDPETAARMEKERANDDLPVNPRILELESALATKQGELDSMARHVISANQHRDHAIAQVAILKSQTPVVAVSGTVFNPDGSATVPFMVDPDKVTRFRGYVEDGHYGSFEEAVQAQVAEALDAYAG